MARDRLAYTCRPHASPAATICGPTPVLQPVRLPCNTMRKTMRCGHTWSSAITPYPHLPMVYRPPHLTHYLVFTFTRSARHCPPWADSQVLMRHVLPCVFERTVSAGVRLEYHRTSPATPSHTIVFQCLCGAGCTNPVAVYSFILRRPSVAFGGVRMPTWVAVNSRRACGPKNPPDMLTTQSRRR